MSLLTHENLDAYHCSIEFLAVALRLLSHLPRGEREIRDQLKRAAISIPLNIAEGAGKPTNPDRARFHAIARGSAMERAALLDVCRIAGLIPQHEAEQGKELVTRIVAMLTRMCRLKVR
jgi:four helix bundle protein